MLTKVELFVFDTETDNLNTFEVNLVGVSFCIKPDEAFFVAINPFRSESGFLKTNISDRLSLNVFIKIFKTIFENDQIKKVCQNGKYDIAVLRSI